MKVKALKMRLRAMGVTEEQLDDLDDEDDAKAAAIRLILHLASGEGGAAAPVSPVQAAAAQAGVPNKYVAAQNQIRMGQPADATHGIQVLMGMTDAALGQYLQDPVGTIRKEFAKSGGADDKENLRCVLGGIKRAGWTAGQSLEALVAHPHAQLAKLQTHHVLALRLYTTSSYCRVNDPLRRVPPQRPHPFAATTYSINAGIKLLRSVAATQPDAHETRVFWRGTKDLGLTQEFLDEGPDKRLRPRHVCGGCGEWKSGRLLCAQWKVVRLVLCKRGHSLGWRLSPFGSLGFNYKLWSFRGRY
jgi:hypothetical protein